MSNRSERRKQQRLNALSDGKISYHGLNFDAHENEKIILYISGYEASCLKAAIEHLDKNHPDFFEGQKVEIVAHSLEKNPTDLTRLRVQITKMPYQKFYALCILSGAFAKVECEQIEPLENDHPSSGAMPSAQDITANEVELIKKQL